MKKSTTTFPNAAMPLDMQVDIQAPKPLGVTAKVFISEAARKLSLYDQPIKCDAKGQDSKSKKIAVNTVGRWLFGVPGYEGHVRVVPANDKVLLYYPKESPKVVHELIASLKEAVETAK
ncbi:hypothetical protein AUJ42_02040 [Candidatus Collierbacteria bacterium CG1_02_44_10]|uniref:Uncharacterized protein n=1 Tax=Candidatus Collierbacteria bacterium CG1_02_44_10 TaxID=1805087 RepID=A0A1J4RVV2_9BACT|nr:MAG: hypothetical protein AUJ42_02040 [Candidatus Collierbacteria bacterium CG1_02_44_10]